MNLRQIRVIDPILTHHIQGYRNAAYVGMALFPAVPVNVSGGQVLEFGKDRFQLKSTQRAPGGATKRVDTSYLGKPFALENHGLEAKVPIEHQRDAEQVPGINLASNAIETAMDGVQLSLEVQQAALATDVAQYDANHKLTLSGTDKWSDPASKPGLAVAQAREAVRASCAVRPNTGVMGAKVFASLCEHPAILDKFKYTSSDSITVEMMCKYFQLESLVVGDAVTDQGGASFTDIWGNVFVLAYVNRKPSPQKETPSYGYTYTMAGHPCVKKPYYEDNCESWIYGVKYERAPVLSGIASGFLFQNII